MTTNQFSPTLVSPWSLPETLERRFVIDLQLPNSLSQDEDTVDVAMSFAMSVGRLASCTIRQWLNACATCYLTQVSLVDPLRWQLVIDSVYGFEDDEALEAIQSWIGEVWCHSPSPQVTLEHYPRGFDD